MKKKLLSACVALTMGVGAGYASSVLAQAKPDVLVKQRQSAMTLIAKYFGPVAGMAQGKIPYDNAVAMRNAGYLAVLAQMPWDGFNASTKDEKNTKAQPAIFENEAKFKEAQERFTGAVTKLAAAKDEAAIKAAAGEVGKSCSACHNDFRAK